MYSSELALKMMLDDCGFMFVVDINFQENNTTILPFIISKMAVRVKKHPSALDLEQHR